MILAIISLSPLGKDVQHQKLNFKELFSAIDSDTINNEENSVENIVQSNDNGKNDDNFDE